LCFYLASWSTIIVVEAAYCWAPSNAYKDKPAPFPESPEGQKEFWEQVNQMVMATPEGRGIGLFWWEPVVAASTGAFTL
jgi:arabinogalactan endo-1,4-beta-galactosidase